LKFLPNDLSNKIVEKIEQFELEPKVGLMAPNIDSQQLATDRARRYFLNYAPLKPYEFATRVNGAIMNDPQEAKQLNAQAQAQQQSLPPLRTLQQYAAHEMITTVLQLSRALSHVHNAHNLRSVTFVSIQNTALYGMQLSTAVCYQHRKNEKTMQHCTIQYILIIFCFSLT